MNIGRTVKDTQLSVGIDYFSGSCFGGRKDEVLFIHI